MVKTFKISTAMRVKSECNQPRYTCDILEYLFKSTAERLPLVLKPLLLFGEPLGQHSSLEQAHAAPQRKGKKTTVIPYGHVSGHKNLFFKTQ